MDSSIIAAITARKTRERLRTFSIRFEDPRYDEGPQARAVAEHIGSDHTEAIIKADAVNLLPELIRAYDEPFGDPAALPGYHLAELGARHVKVCLSGDGGDELFGGYDRYVRSRRLSGIDKIPVPARRALAHFGAWAIPEHVRGHDLFQRLGEPLHVRYLREFGGFDAAWRVDLLEPGFGTAGTADDSFFRPYLGGEDCAGDPLTQMQFADVSTYLPECILTKVDRITMAHSLEVRPPLLDHRIVETAFSLPPSMKIRDGRRKWILRAAGEDLLPPGFLDRRKRGFTVPLREWFRTDLRLFAEKTLLAPRAGTRGVLRPKAIRRILDLHGRRQRDFADRIWSLLVLEYWFRAYLEQKSGS
jgi:asparagine synthase (glutamine-hydrolysing)